MLFLDCTKCDCSVPVQPDVSVFQTHTHTQYTGCVIFFVNVTEQDGFIRKDFLETGLTQIAAQRKPHACTQTQTT